jgi:hypothetical protein
MACQLLSYEGVSDRRRNKRFSLTEPANASLRLFPDVVVQKDGDGEWTGISRLPVASGETFVLDVVQVDEIDGEVRRRVPVCVIESQPLLVEGELCHRIRLHTGILSSLEFEQHVRRG